jgi:rRNA maturation endonuclease Nob1
MNGEFLTQSILQMIFILILLGLAALLIPWIISKILKSRQRICECGQKLNPEDVFCPRCGKRVEKK